MAGKFLNLELLRFFAASWVVSLHAAGFYQARGIEPALFNLYVLGGAGVDLFFVISGFVIATSQLHSTKSFLRFGLNRLIRIVPAYFSATTAFLVLIFLSGQLGVESDFGDALNLSWIASSYLFSSQLFGFGEPLLYVGWTLEYEMLFYLVFSLCILLTSSPKMQVGLTSAGLIAFTLINPAAMVILEFVFGMFLAVALARLKPSIQVGGILLLGSALWFWFGGGMQNFLGQSMFLGIGFSSVVAGAVLITQVRSKLVTHLGASSYASYLLQVITIPVFGRFLYELLPVEILMFIGVPLVVIIKQIFASYFESLFDSRVRDILRRKLLRSLR